MVHNVPYYVYIASYKAYLERKKLEEAEAKQKKAESKGRSSCFSQKTSRERA